MITFALIAQSLKEYANFVRDYKYSNDDLWKIIGGITILILLIIYYFFFTGTNKNTITTSNEKDDSNDYNITVKIEKRIK